MLLIAGGDNPIDSAEILPGCPRREPGSGKKPRYFRSLAFSYFDGHEAPRCDQLRACGDEGVICVEALRAAVEGQPRSKDATSGISFAIAALAI